MTESIDKLPAITNLSKKEKKILKDNLVKFHIFSKMLSTKQANGIEVSRLASLRDILLPRLMSGELKINELTE